MTLSALLPKLSILRRKENSEDKRILIQRSRKQAQEEIQEQLESLEWFIYKLPEEEYKRSGKVIHQRFQEIVMKWMRHERYVLAVKSDLNYDSAEHFMGDFHTASTISSRALKTLNYYEGSYYRAFHGMTLQLENDTWVYFIPRTRDMKNLYLLFPPPYPTSDPHARDTV